jgi:hypothetical protein
MTCKTCSQLSAHYERAVQLYSNAARNLAGLCGDDFTKAFAEAERLRRACVTASDELKRHWVTYHSILSQTKQPARPSPS